MKIPAILEKVLKFLPMVFDVVDSISKRVAKSKPVNEKSSAEDVSEIIELFETCKKEVHGKAAAVEDVVYEEVSSYIEEIGGYLEKYEGILKKYSIKKRKVKRETERLLSFVRGGIDEEINKRFTLNDRELQGIVRMLPGQKKEDALQEFYRKALEAALEHCCRKVQETSADLYEILEEDILERMEQAGHVLEQACGQLEQLENAEDPMAEKDMAAEGIKVIAAGDIVETLLGGI